IENNAIRLHRLTVHLSYSLFFFFQAEDGIRDFHVTGVQTCALPIYPREQHDDEDPSGVEDGRERQREDGLPRTHPGGQEDEGGRSEERRVGKECRSRSSPEQ